VNVDGPIHADWQQDSIAVAIDRDREKRGAERAIVRVIPDYVYFNNATISYAVKLGQYPLVVLGTSGFPLFTDYVVLKSGNTGDDSSARDRLRGEILSGASSAKGMYNILARWPLPDGSEAMLIRVEPKPATGVPARTIEEKVRLHADQFVKKYFRPVGGYTLTVSAIDSSETVKGHLKGITVAFDDAECGDFAFNPTGLPVRNVRFEISDLRFDPGRLVSDDTLLLVSIGGLSVKNFTVTAAALRTYAEQSSDGAITVDSLSVGSGAIHFAGSSRGFGPKIGFDLELYSFGHENIWFTFESLRLGGIPIPAFLVNVMSSSFNPVLSGLERLSEVHLGTLALEDNQIRVGG
jgi:hypothetical protein